MQSVASGWLAVAAGAQDPQCTDRVMRNPSTAGCRQAPAQQLCMDFLAEVPGFGGKPVQPAVQRLEPGRNYVLTAVGVLQLAGQRLLRLVEAALAEGDRLGRRVLCDELGSGVGVDEVSDDEDEYGNRATKPLHCIAKDDSEYFASGRLCSGHSSLGLRLASRLGLV